MQTITNGYRGISLLVQISADRVLVPVAVAGCVTLAATILFRLLFADAHLGPSFL